LRAKIEPAPTNPVLILTEPGIGYRMMAGEQEPERTGYI
jgi:DNA-binding response OmpR family regulator